MLADPLTRTHPTNGHPICTTLFMIACAVVMLQPSAGAQPQHGSLDPAPKTFSLGDKPVTVPMQRLHGWVIVEAMVNDRGPFRFLFDTGAPGLVVDNRYKDEMNLSSNPSFGGMEVRVAGPGGKGLPASLLQADSVKIGEAEMKEISVIATTLPMRRDIAGVLGMGTIKDCLLTLDYPNSKFTLARGELPDANGKDILDYTMPTQRGSHPVVPLEMCGKTIDFTLDTGMTGWLRLPDGIEDACGYLHGPVSGGSARSVDQEFDVQIARMNGDLKIGEYVIQNPHGHMGVTAVDRNHRSPLIGSRIFAKFTVTLDTKNRRILFARDDKSPIRPPAIRSIGFKLQEEDNGYVVWGLIDDSPAAKAGIKKDDIVVALNGQPTADLYGRQAWMEALEADAVNIRYRPAAGGPERDVRVDVVTLLP